MSALATRQWHFMLGFSPAIALDRNLFIHNPNRHN
jgi:hypothetical protein